MTKTVFSLASTMHDFDRTRCTDLLREWADKLSPQVADDRRTAFEEMATTLQGLAQDGFIVPGWRLEWDYERKQWRTRFTIRGGRERTLDALRFRAYLEGWNDRRTAVMHRYR